MPRKTRLVRIRFYHYQRGNQPGYHGASIKKLIQYKRRCAEPFDAVDYDSRRNPHKSKPLGLSPDGHFLGIPLIHNGKKAR